MPVSQKAIPRITALVFHFERLVTRIGIGWETLAGDEIFMAGMVTALRENQAFFHCLGNVFRCPPIGFKPGFGLPPRSVAFPKPETYTFARA
jgi:hypothetical protein